MRTIGIPKPNVNLDTYESQRRIPSSRELELLFLRVDRARPVIPVKGKQEVKKCGSR